MVRAAPPIDMLRKCRGHFAKEAEAYRSTERIAGSVWEKKTAAEYAATNEKFVSDIDATLRDWA
jgi:hypothetical protein